MTSPIVPGVTVPLMPFRGCFLATAAIGVLAASLLAGCGSDSKTAATDAAADGRGAAVDSGLDTADAGSERGDVPADQATIDVAADAGTSDTGGLQVDVTGIDTSGGATDGTAIDTQSAFACGTLGAVPSDVFQRLCFDFSTESQASNFRPAAGTWSVMDGSYHGVGPDGGQVTCPGGPFGGSAMTASVLSNFSAANLRVHARMTSQTRADKVLVLRSQASGDRIELDFRSYFTMGGQQDGGDFVVSTLSACQQTFFVVADSVRVPQYDYQPITVDVQLVGPRLTVAVNGTQIYDGTPMANGIDGGNQLLPTDAGSVGFGVFLDGEVAFDDLVVEALK